MNRTILYLIVVITSTFLQGSSFVATKVLLNTMPPLWLAGLRFFIAAISLLPILAYKFHPTNPTEHKLITDSTTFYKIFLIGLFQTAGVMYLLNTGLKSTPPSTAAIIMASNPILVTILAKFFLKESISSKAIFGLIISFIGVIICIGLTNSGSANSGILLIILASICWAIATIINKKFHLSLNTWIVTFWQMLFGSIILMVVAYLEHEKFTLPISLSQWLALIWLSIPASTIAMGLWFKALLMEGAGKTSGFLFLCPLFSAILSYFVLDTYLSMQEFIGGTLIFLGIYMLSIQKKP